MSRVSESGEGDRPVGDDARRPLGLPPEPPSRLIGRDRELLDAVALLRDEGARLLTLIGPGGVGKTRLALQLAVDRASEYEDGARFVDLSPIRDHALVVPTVGHALGIREEPDRPPLETVIDALRDRFLLLVLDNLEQVAPCAGEIATLLATCPNVTILATSRVALGVRAEHVFPVAPLPVPPEAGSERAGEAAVAAAMASPAVALFVDRARARNPAYRLTGDEAPAVVDICRRLDGLPLALELAAGWSRLLPPSALLARLENRLALLTGGALDLPQRQRTLRDAVAWSYDLLSPGQQRLFRRLAVMVGGCTVETAIGMANQSSESTRDEELLGEFDTLVGHNLVRTASAAGLQRLAMLETIREFGGERLEAAGEWGDARRRHAVLFLRAAEPAEPALWGGPEQARWLDRLAADLDNLRAALDWALAEGDAETALRLAAPLGLLLRARGNLREGRDRLERVLTAFPSARAPSRASVSTVLATVAMTQGHLVRATELAEEALAEWRGLGDRPGIARCLNVLGGCALLRGDLALAATRLDEALGLRRALGDEAGVASVLQNLGAVAALRGEGAAAASHLDEARGLARKVGDKLIEAVTLRQLAELAQGRGEYARATDLGEAALALNRELGDKADAAWSLVRLGSVALDEGDAERAEPLLGEAIGLGREVGDEPAVGETLVLLGRAAARRGDDGAASAALDEALEIGRGLDDDVIVGGALRTRADLSAARGDGAAAATRLREALARFAAGDDVPNLLGPLIGAGLLATRARLGASAARLLGAAEALRERIGVVLPAAERPEHERAVAELRGELGKARLAEAWAAGRSLPARGVVAEALAMLNDVPDALPSRPVAREGDAARPAGLSEREVEVLRLVAGGLSNAEIAERLFLSPHTVNAHLRRIYDKLDVTSRSAATRFALEHGLG